LEKELEEDRKQSSAKIEELTRESRQGSMERQAALCAVRDRASAAEADATRAETRVVELTDAAAELARALDAEREENAERDRSAAALASGVDALRTELEETRARLERLADERDRAREEVAEARAEARERNAALDVRSADESADRPPAVSPSRVDDKGPVTIPNGGAFGGGGFDVSALVESSNRRRKERARQTDAIRAAVRDAEARHAEESAKRVAELTDARERAESAESALAVLAADVSDASAATAADADSAETARRRAAIDAASANLERYREEARVANEARAALAADRETLLEMLGEKTETCDSLETSLRLATERLERRDATDALRVSRPVSHNRGGRSRMTRDEKRPSRRDAYVATLTHAVFVARGGSELEPADD
jgi:chromosome segregation ATPase